MRRLATTVVGLVGPGAAPVLERLQGAANVRVSRPEAADPLDRAVSAWGEAAGAHVPYFVHDADPLAVVATAWADRLGGAGVVGELEVAVSATLAWWRAGSVELPDYYVVVGPAELPAPLRDWYLGVLAARAPRRVVPLGPPAEPGAGAVDLHGQLRRLPAGRWWPPLDDLLDEVDRVVPAPLVHGAPATSADLVTGRADDGRTGPRR